MTEDAVAIFVGVVPELRRHLQGLEERQKKDDSDALARLIAAAREQLRLSECMLALHARELGLPDTTIAAMLGDTQTNIEQMVQCAMDYTKPAVRTNP
jgi:hypothetical protein